MDEWITYTEAGERLGISAEAVRQRAIRGHWPRQRSNEGGALVRIPDGITVRRRTPVEQRNEPPPENVREHPIERLISALERHIADLQTNLALARGENESLRAELAAERGAAREAMEAHRKLADELVELRRAAATTPVPAPASRRSAPRSRPEPTSNPSSEPSQGVVTAAELDTEAGMERIRQKLMARLAGH